MKLDKSSSRVKDQAVTDSTKMCILYDKDHECTAEKEYKRKSIAQVSQRSWVRIPFEPQYFLGFICNCLNYFTTANITPTWQQRCGIKTPPINKFQPSQSSLLYTCSFWNSQCSVIVYCGAICCQTNLRKKSSSKIIKTLSEHLGNTQVRTPGSNHKK